MFLLVACQDNAPAGKYEGAMVLALSWQPGFCETRPRLPECKSQTSTRYDADRFSLHGLWPQPGSNVYCGVSDANIKLDKSRRWKKLVGLGLSDELKKKLWQIMPGARSFLHRHEWIKHGTCYSNTAETYYRDSAALLEAINGAPVQQLFASNIGKKITGSQIRNAFDRSFADGVGKRVRVACKRDGNRTIITEITLGLKGAISSQPDIAALALASPTTKPGCPFGIVDPVGLQ